MKKVFIISFAAFLMATGVKADDGTKGAKAMENVSDNTLRNFGYTFYRATDVSWSITDEYQKATFTQNGITSFAIYDKTGNLLVATQTAKVSEFPARAQEIIESSYKNYKVSNAVKVLARPVDYKYSDDTGSFWVSLVGEGEHIVLLVSPSANVSVVSAKKTAI